MITFCIYFSLLEIADLCYYSSIVFLKVISTGIWKFYIAIVRLYHCLFQSNQLSCLEYGDLKRAFSCALYLIHRGRETLWLMEVYVRTKAFIWKKKEQNKADPFSFNFLPKPLKSPRNPTPWQKSIFRSWVCSLFPDILCSC